LSRACGPEIDSAAKFVPAAGAQLGGLDVSSGRQNPLESIWH
jgi:hypothetical protein